ncbi:MAG: AI-2E family transporter [Inquilinus sp.]|nr:AI-2E family transporter [Inquilinus sp.]
MAVPGWFLAVVVMAIALRFVIEARAFLLPLATAVLLFTLLAAVIDRIAGLRVAGFPVPRWLAHIAGIAVILLGLTAVAAILSGQADALNAAIPRYVELLQQLFAAGVAHLDVDIAAQLERALTQIDITRTATGLVGSAGSMLTGIGLVVLYVAFMLGERGVAKGKLKRIFPDSDHALDVGGLILDIATSVRRYVWIKTVVSVMTGTLAYAVLKPLGVDFAETWALLIFLFNYIPNIGSILGTILPAIVALVQFDTITPFLVVVIVVGALQFLIGNVVEPLMMGRSLRLSSFAIILSLIFWGAVWGVMGMFLSVPIMVVVMIVCAQVPAWRWVSILLSSDGSLPGEAPEAV